MSSPLKILGGGMAGLSTGYFAQKYGIPFTIYEADEQVGGNTKTFQHGDFRFDSGAHRFHDKDPLMTRELKLLLGDDLTEIHAPSQIYHNGRFINFPLSPLNLMFRLGPVSFLGGALDVLRSRLKQSHKHQHFESFAVQTYGKDIAKRFLLNYSEKLWGSSCENLSIDIAGKRLKGLDLRTFLVESFMGRSAATRHMERASFYYPLGGIQCIPDRMAGVCDSRNIRCGARVTKVFHTETRLQAMELNHAEIVGLDRSEVVSTLPLPSFIQSLDPSPPEPLLEAARSLRFRSMVLVTHLLTKESVTNNATVYFPDSNFPFTRIYEPRNRDHSLSPVGFTSLVAEIPCQQGDAVWEADRDELIDRVRIHLIRMGWIHEGEIMDATIRRFSNAYPILERGYEEKVSRLNAYLSRFSNLKSEGRNAKFVYSWIHDMMRYGFEVVSSCHSGVSGQICEPEVLSGEQIHS
ncbi:MAG: FAD-dependent oxidoreductase [Candidatus Eisenbacteria bacterium]|uniref:FAD-dependent oxidoreductase n=1 Tax=Eiseniibacteriota bacterium TaxID=2212470 RepID=A0A948RXV9_UNCEI|nr:FAD-dependent oxidoreductase [Candidatus Eisenbacteria bacterium]MBU1948448.1 FAD-dependent oxidoreductase [Candidatus Eisenbacteria bacterium]MBU2692481.1 FAD-dependent oxidoreductase [Candidatus Eisenbacteria bacterium]